MVEQGTGEEEMDISQYGAQEEVVEQSSGTRVQHSEVKHMSKWWNKRKENEEVEHRKGVRQLQRLSRGGRTDKVVEQRKVVQKNAGKHGNNRSSGTHGKK